MTCVCWVQPSRQWHIQRVTALVMLPLWLSLQSTIVSFLTVILPLHIHMGLQEIFEDYVYNDTSKYICIWLLRLWVLLSIKVFIMSFLV